MEALMEALMALGFIAIVFFCFAFLFFTKHPEELHKYLISFKKTDRKIRFSGKIDDLLKICSSQVFQTSTNFVQDFTSLQYLAHYSKTNSLLRRYAYVCSVFEQCNFLCYAVNDRFAHKVMKYSFDCYHESVLRVSSLLNGDEIKFDNDIVLDIENLACSSEEIEPILYYYKLVMLILLRSKIVKDPADISFEEVRPLIDFVQSWSKSAIDDLAKVYDSVRPFIKK